jgi:hypothetical protein
MECAATSRLALRPNLSAGRVDDAPRDVEAEPEKKSRHFCMRKTFGPSGPGKARRFSKPSYQETLASWERGRNLPQEQSLEAV